MRGDGRRAAAGGDRAARARALRRDAAERPEADPGPHGRGEPGLEHRRGGRAERRRAPADRTGRSRRRRGGTCSSSGPSSSDRAWRQRERRAADGEPPTRSPPRRRPKRRRRSAEAVSLPGVALGAIVGVAARGGDLLGLRPRTASEGDHVASTPPQAAAALASACPGEPAGPPPLADHDGRRATAAAQPADRVGDDGAGRPRPSSAAVATPVSRRSPPTHGLHRITMRRRPRHSSAQVRRLPCPAAARCGAGRRQRAPATSRSTRYPWTRVSEKRARARGHAAGARRAVGRVARAHAREPRSGDQADVPGHCESRRDGEPAPRTQVGAPERPRDATLSDREASRGGGRDTCDCVALACLGFFFAAGACTFLVLDAACTTSGNTTGPTDGGAPLTDSSGTEGSTGEAGGGTVWNIGVSNSLTGGLQGIGGPLHNAWSVAQTLRQLERRRPRKERQLHRDRRHQRREHEPRRRRRHHRRREPAARAGGGRGHRAERQLASSDRAEQFFFQAHKVLEITATAPTSTTLSTASSRPADRYLFRTTFPPTTSKGKPSRGLAELGPAGLGDAGAPPVVDSRRGRRRRRTSGGTGSGARLPIGACSKMALLYYYERLRPADGRADQDDLRRDDRHDDRRRPAGRHDRPRQLRDADRHDHRRANAPTGLAMVALRRRRRRAYARAQPRA